MPQCSHAGRLGPASRPAPAEPAVALSLLGGFEMRVDGERVSVPSSAQRVIAFLSLNPGSLARVFVAGRLWMDASDERAAAALRTALWRLGSLGSLLVTCEGRSLRLNPRTQIDVDDSTRIARAILDDAAAVPSPVAFGRLRDARELLPDWYDDWILVERERIRQLRLHALEELCRRSSAAGRHVQATEAGLAAVQSEPLRESAHRALVAAHLAQGNTVDALRQYHVCRRLLRRNLDVGPSPALESLVAALVPGDGAVTAAR